MSFLRYEFTIRKIAAINSVNGPLPIGDVEEYLDQNGQVKIGIRFHDNIPDEIVQACTYNPQAISIVGYPTQEIRNIQFSTPPSMTCTVSHASMYAPQECRNRYRVHPGFWAIVGLLAIMLGIMILKIST